MSIIIDVNRNSCTIYQGKYYQIIIGDSSDICNKIIKYITKDGKSDIQYEDIILDCHGMGRAYADYFESNNIRFIEMKHKNILAPFDI